MLLIVGCCGLCSGCPVCSFKGVEVLAAIRAYGHRHSEQCKVRDRGKGLARLQCLCVCVCVCVLCVYVYASCVCVCACACAFALFSTARCAAVTPLSHPVTLGGAVGIRPLADTRAHPRFHPEVCPHSFACLCMCLPPALLPTQVRTPHTSSSLLSSFAATQTLCCRLPGTATTRGPFSVRCGASSGCAFALTASKIAWWGRAPLRFCPSCATFPSSTLRSL